MKDLCFLRKAWDFSVHVVYSITIVLYDGGNIVIHYDPSLRSNNKLKGNKKLFFFFFLCLRVGFYIEIVIFERYMSIIKL